MSSLVDNRKLVRYGYFYFPTENLRTQNGTIPINNIGKFK